MPVSTSKFLNVLLFRKVSRGWLGLPCRLFKQVCSAAHAQMRRAMPKLANTAPNWSRCRNTSECGLDCICNKGTASNMTQIQPAALPTFSGKVSGGIPNLFWRRMSFEQLRAQNKYHGLPPVEQLQFTSTTDYR